MRVNAKNYAYFEYPPYLDRNDQAMTEKPHGCPFDVGDVVVISNTSSIGVVLGCICADGDLRTDADGMQCWSTKGNLRLATKADLLNNKLRRSPKLNKELKKYMSKSKKRTHLPYTYRVNVCRIAYGNQDIKVVAMNKREAQRQAEDEAGNLSYTEHTAEYQAQSVTRLDQIQPFMGG